MGHSPILAEPATDMKTHNGSSSKNFYDQGFIGLGARTSIGIAERSGNTEFRIISWDNAIVYEGGGYSSFRKMLGQLTTHFP